MAFLVWFRNFLMLTLTCKSTSLKCAYSNCPYSLVLRRMTVKMDCSLLQYWYAQTNTAPAGAPRHRPFIARRCPPSLKDDAERGRGLCVTFEAGGASPSPTVGDVVRTNDISVHRPILLLRVLPAAGIEWFYEYQSRKNDHITFFKRFLQGGTVIFSL